MPASRQPKNLRRWGFSEVQPQEHGLPELLMDREQPVPFLNLCHLPGFGISPQPAWQWNLSPNSFPYMQLCRLSRLPMSVGWTIVARVGGRM